MSANKVRPGDPIKASQLNSVIDSVSIAKPNTSMPFRNTMTGGLVNGGHIYTTKSPSVFDALFNISYGPGYLNGLFDDGDKNWTGIWAQIGNWTATDPMLYHTPFFVTGTHALIIDPTTQEGQPKLIPTFGLINKQGRIPICLATSQAGIAVFQCFGEATDPGTGNCCIVIGDFTKFGAEEGTSPDIDGDYDDYLTAIKEALPTIFANADEIALRHTSPLYVRDPNMEEDIVSTPVAYSIGQQHIESIPDGNQGGRTIGKEVYLSSLEFTPETQMDMQYLQPTFSYSLYNFHKKECDYATLKELKEAPALSSSMTGLSAFDLMLRHKDKHPKDSGPAANNAMARLEYISLSAITDLLGGTVDSKLSSLHLSSIAEHIHTDPDTHEDTKYHQLYGFDAQGMGTFALSDQNEFDIVVRDWHTTGGNGARVNYVNLSAFVDSVRDGLSVKVDSRDGGLSSIGYDEDDRLELYNFSQGQRVQKNDKFDIVVRDNQHGKVDYTPLSALGSGYPGPWEITIDEQTGNATFTNCVAKVARAYHFFQDQSANVGGGDKMVYFVMTHTTSPSVHMYVGNYSSAAGLLGGSDANCISASITPLYRVTDNKVTCDFRYMLNIQAYDNRNFSSTMYY